MSNTKWHFDCSFVRCIGHMLSLVYLLPLIVLGFFLPLISFRDLTYEPQSPLSYLKKMALNFCFLANCYKVHVVEEIEH